MAAGHGSFGWLDWVVLTAYFVGITPFYWLSSSMRAVAGVRIGDFKLVTFPGELSVQIGLDIKKAANNPHAFIAGYTNGYIYYTPTIKQRNNTGYAQEDCDSLVAPEWQKVFETKALEVLKKL